MPPERQNKKTKTSAAKHTRGTSGATQRRQRNSARRLSAARSCECGERIHKVVVEILVVGEIIVVGEISVVVVVARAARSVELVKLLAGVK